MVAVAVAVVRAAAVLVAVAVVAAGKQSLAAAVDGAEFCRPWLLVFFKIY